MDKPLTIARHDFMEKMTELINESGLPAFVISDIFELTLPTLKVLAQQQLETDQAAYKEGEEDGEY